jgi:hypothetical protein
MPDLKGATIMWYYGSPLYNIVLFQAVMEWFNEQQRRHQTPPRKTSPTPQPSSKLTQLRPTHQQ